MWIQTLKFKPSLVLFGLLWPLFSQATSFIQQSFEEKVAEAPFIVRGAVGTHYTGWAADKIGTQRIYTFTSLRVDEVIKGQIKGPNLVVRQLGGKRDDVEMAVPGTAVLNPGEDVVLLLSSPNPDGSYDVSGMMMGKYNIVQNEKGEEYLTGPGLDANAHDDDADLGSASDSKVKSWSYIRLKNLVDSRAPIQQQQPPKAAQPQALTEAPALHRPQSMENPVPKSSVQAPSESQSSVARLRMIMWVSLLMIFGFGGMLLIQLFKKRK